jgi:hypothetical protein
VPRRNRSVLNGAGRFERRQADRAERIPDSLRFVEQELKASWAARTRQPSEADIVRAAEAKAYALEHAGVRRVQING